MCWLLRRRLGSKGRVMIACDRVSLHDEIAIFAELAAVRISTGTLGCSAISTCLQLSRCMAVHVLGQDL